MENASLVEKIKVGMEINAFAKKASTMLKEHAFNVIQTQHMMESIVFAIMDFSTKITNAKSAIQLVEHALITPPLPVLRALTSAMS